jgi:hypothetical protein
MNEILTQLMAALIPIFGTILTALVSWAALEFAKYIKTKTKNELAYNAVATICDATETTVAKFNQTVIPELKKRAADGKLSRSDINEVKKMAMIEVKKQIPDAIDAAARMSVNSITDLITGKIEKAVGESKSNLASILTARR